MKKLMMIAAMMLMSMGAFAQSQFAVGVDGNMAFKSGNTRFGVGAKFQYEFVEDFRAEANFKFYPKKDYNTAWNANLNLEYLIRITEGFNVYPIVGVGMFGMSYDYSDFNFGSYYSGPDSESTTAFVFHGGAGAEYFVAENIKLYLDSIYQYGKKDGFAICDNPLLSVGVAFAF